MLLFLIIIYLLLTIVVGIIASRKVKNTSDYLIAGRHLPFYLATATVFATWFGSETLLGASSQMSEKGLMGVIEDPFGASLCLILIGLFFAKPLYRMNLLTFGDFYRIKYNHQTEIIASILLIISYFGWIAAQMVALGILFNVVADIPVHYGILIGSFAVVIYTFLGGMWSLAITDFMQTIVIIAGLLFVTVEIMTMVDFSTVIEQTPSEHFDFFPSERNFSSWLNYLAMWMTIGLGSIPQQDVFQRVMSSKSENVAVTSSIFAAFLYLSVAMMPLIIVMYTKVLYPEIYKGNTQLAIPNAVLFHSNLFVKVLFFGALISAIMSTASGAILAPAAILSENIIKPYIKNISDRQFLRITRLSVILISVVSLLFAFLNSNIYKLVGTASALSLVSLFIPLVAGLFWKKATPVASIISMIAGFVCWLLAIHFETELNPLLYGLAGSFCGMISGMVVRHKNSK